jgi:hypothetical protein
MFYFQAKPGGTDWSPQLAVYGDLGNDNAQSLTRLQRETQEQFYDAIIHVGDFAYNMEDVNAAFFGKDIKYLATLSITTIFFHF